jgi:hypothetical protein
MKTTIEVNGYEIVIEETEGIVSVKAMQDDEVVEEFQLESEGSEDFDSDDDMKDFDDFEGEEEEDFDDDMESDDDDMESDDMESDDDMEDDMESDDDDDMEDDMEDDTEEMEDSEGPKLESFQSFLKKRK